MKCDAYKGQTQCQRLPHEWGLGKGITEEKSYPRRNSVERRSVMPIWPTIQYKGIYFSYEYVVHAELFIDNLRHVGQQVLRADPTMYDFKTSCKFSTYYRFHIHFWQYMQYEFCDFASYLWWKPVFFFSRIRRRAAYLCIMRAKSAPYKDHHLTPPWGVRNIC
jgi:hypothetical protein